MADTEKANSNKVIFTTLRGGKGYAVDEVDAYVETIRSAYSELEQELNEVSRDRDNRIADLSAEQESCRQMQNQIFEMSGTIDDSLLQLVQAVKASESLREKSEQAEKQSAELAEDLEDAKHQAELNQQACSAGKRAHWKRRQSWESRQS